MVKATKKHPKLIELENKINDLKVEYESYFLGITKVEPYTLKQEVESLIRFCIKNAFSNAVNKFKFKQLTARYNTFNNYWTRILRKIEDGTYERDKFKMELKDKQGFYKNGSGAIKSIKSQEADGYRHLYNEFIEAKKKCNERIDNIGYLSFKKHMLTQARNLRVKYESNIEFKIDVENGTIKIKAVKKND